GGLEEISGRPGTKALEDVFVDLETRQHQHPGTRLLGDGAGRGDPVDMWHADVHEDDIRVERARLRHRDRAVGGFAHHLDVLARIEQEPQARADGAVIVGEQHPDRHVVLLLASGSCTYVLHSFPSRPERACPPTAAARSAMLRRPFPTPRTGDGSAGSESPIGFTTSIPRRPSVSSKRRVTGRPGACLTAFVRVSWTMR